MPRVILNARSSGAAGIAGVLQGKGGSCVILAGRCDAEPRDKLLSILAFEFEDWFVEVV